MWSIILEKLSGDDSFWAPYFSEDLDLKLQSLTPILFFSFLFLEILPDEVYLPSIWREEDLSFLQGTGMEELIPDSSEQFRKYFLSIKSAFPQTAALSEKELERLFHYAGCIISAYSFCEDADQELDIGLVPLADTLNHKTGFNNARLYYEKEHLKMICHADCPKGEQLFNTYGDLGNRDLLIKYGFVDDPNPFHVLTLDPIEWLRDHLQQCKIGADVKRVCDSDPSAFNLFDKFDGKDGKLPCNLAISPSSSYGLDGMKTFIDWIYLLTLPAKTSLNSLKPRANYDAFLSHGDTKAGILEILQARRSLLPPNKMDVCCWNYGPKLYAQIIKNQDIDILDGYISYIKSLM